MVLLTVYSPETTLVLQQPQTPARQATVTGTLLLQRLQQRGADRRIERFAGCSLVNFSPLVAAWPPA
jgi:hypothetical protein